MTGKEVEAMAVIPYRVTSNQPAHGKLNDQTYGPGHLITVQLESGSSGQVFVSNMDYANRAKVAEILADKVRAVDYVDRLGTGQ